MFCWNILSEDVIRNVNIVQGRVLILVLLEYTLGEQNKTVSVYQWVTLA